jgi:hypothetical protein
MPMLMLLGHWRDLGLHLSNIRRAWTWTLTDLKWLFLAGPAMVSSRISLPDQGKFNAGEKINFTLLMSTYPVYVYTGLMIWFTAIPYLSWLVSPTRACRGRRRPTTRGTPRSGAASVSACT